MAWVAFELSREREEAEGGERLLAAQSVIVLKRVQQMFTPRAGTTSVCSGHLGLKPKIPAISPECLCGARGDTHHRRQLLRFRQELTSRPPASVTANDPNQRASRTPRWLRRSAGSHLTIRALHPNVFR